MELVHKNSLQATCRPLAAGPRRPGKARIEKVTHGKLVYSIVLIKSKFDEKTVSAELAEIAARVGKEGFNS